MHLWIHVAIWKNLVTSVPYPCRELLLLERWLLPLSSSQLACVPTVPTHLPSLRLSGKAVTLKLVLLAPTGCSERSWMSCFIQVFIKNVEGEE